MSAQKLLKIASQQFYLLSTNYSFDSLANKLRKTLCEIRFHYLIVVVRLEIYSNVTKQTLINN